MQASLPVLIADELAWNDSCAKFRGKELIARHGEFFFGRIGLRLDYSEIERRIESNPVTTHAQSGVG